MRFTHSYKATLVTCFLGYVTQAIAINLLPLLFVTFQREFSVSLEQLGLLITVSFIVQMTVDLLATRYGDLIGYRTGSIASQVTAVLGLVSLGVLPYCLPDPYVGLMIGTVLMAIGGGLIEVLISPIVDALPGESRPGIMSLLHSFFSWGFLAVVLLSTVYFAVCGIENWRWLPMLWAIPPFITALLFCVVPLPDPKTEEGGNKTVLRRLLASPQFWLMMLLMLCAGSSEIAASQWASLFAEVGLGVPKAMGDLIGPCGFALLMAISRVYFAGGQRAKNMTRSLTACGLGCVCGYLLIVLSPWPLLSLAGFAVCGFSVGLMWPGVLSLGAKAFPTGGTAMFSLLALCGDIGCSIGPGIVGGISNALQRVGEPTLIALKWGIAVAAMFPFLLFICVRLLCRIRMRETS